MSAAQEVLSFQFSRVSHTVLKSKVQSVVVHACDPTSHRPKLEAWSRARGPLRPNQIFALDFQWLKDSGDADTGEKDRGKVARLSLE